MRADCVLPSLSPTGNTGSHADCSSAPAGALRCRQLLSPTPAEVTALVVRGNVMLPVGATQTRAHLLLLLLQCSSRVARSHPAGFLRAEWQDLSFASALEVFSLSYFKLVVSNNTRLTSLAGA